jgi:hypothetical protein
MSAIPHPVRVSVSEYLATGYRLDCDEQLFGGNTFQKLRRFCWIEILSPEDTVACSREPSDHTQNLAPTTSRLPILN